MGALDAALSEPPPAVCLAPVAALYGLEPPPVATVGAPIWGPAALLADLELRLGLPAATTSSALRAARYAARLDAAAAGAFYAGSLGADRSGTTRTLLAWRDELVLAGWTGAALTGAGKRLADLARVEADPLPLAPGYADRVATVALGLRDAKRSPYASLTLTEAPDEWPPLWRRIFDSLRSLNCPVAPRARSEATAPPDSDLGRLQAGIRAGTTDARFSGDGSLLFLRAPSSRELAEAVAAQLAASRTAGTVIIRGADASTLDAALTAHGLAQTGVASRSRWRPALQVLSLALELAFEPRDPRRVLELLTLPVGPLSGAFGRRMARALAEMPGLGGKHWAEACTEAAESLRKRAFERSRAAGEDEATATARAAREAERRVERLREWVESPGFSGEGAPRDGLVEVVMRVETWARARLRASDVGDDDLGLGSLLARAGELRTLLASEPGATLTLVEVRRRVDAVTEAGERLRRTDEQAGRVAHVDDPAALAAAHERIVWWGAVASEEPRFRGAPWRKDERAALLAAGVEVPDPARVLLARATAWRAPALFATKQLVLAVPDVIAGAPAEPHPLWDEIVARAGADAASLAATTKDTRTLLSAAARDFPTESVPALATPGGTDLWQVEGTQPLVNEQFSATSLEHFVLCPLRYVLSDVARLRSGAVVRLPAGPLLFGKLAHRLVEQLHAGGAFDGTVAADLDARVRRALDELVEKEAATLVLPGEKVAQRKLVGQLVRAVRALAELLADGGFRIAGVEEEVSTQWLEGRELHGRLDLRVAKGDESVVIDLKWGRASYKTKLEENLAVQLAAYLRAASHEHAAYYAVSRGELVATEKAAAALGVETFVEGEEPGTTWDRVDRTATAVTRMLAGERTVAVTGLKRSLPLLAHAGVPEALHEKHLVLPQKKDDAVARICAYCGNDAICGRRWEDLA